MRAEHLEGWLAETRKEEATEAKIEATEGTTELHGEAKGDDTEEGRKNPPAWM